MDERRQAVWYQELESFGVGEVEQALRSLLEDTPTFAPRLGAVLNELRPRPPRWDEIWPCVSATLGRVSPTYRGERAALNAIRASCGEPVAAWVAVYGAKRLSLEPVFDPEVGGIVEARLRKSFTEQVKDRGASKRAAAKLQRLIGAEDSKQLEAGDEAGDV